jgi:hypothetical protein
VSTTLRGRLQLMSLNDRDCEVPDSSSGGADNLTRSFSTPPRIRTPSGSFEGCHAFQHTRRAQFTKNQNAKHPTADAVGSPGCITSVSRPGFEPGPGPSEGPMRSVTPSRQISFDPQQSGPTAGFAPASSCSQDRRLSHSSHVGNRGEQHSTSARSRTP